MIFQGLLNYRLSNSFKGWSWANPLLRTNSLYHGKLTAIFFLTLYPRVQRLCLFLVKRAKNHQESPLNSKGKASCRLSSYNMLLHALVVSKKTSQVARLTK